MNKVPSTSTAHPEKELKTVKLSKFPLHQYYFQMEGIL